VRSQHSVVELVEEGGVFFGAVLFSEAEGMDALDEDFGGVGLGFDDLDGLVEVVLERHRARVGGLLATHEFGLDVGRDDFEDFDVGGFELVAQCLAVGVDGRLGCAVGGRHRHRDEGETGGDGEDGGVGLLLELREQRGGEADGAEQVGGDDGFGVGQSLRLVQEFFRAHDACVVDDGVEGGVIGGEPGCDLADVGGSSMLSATELMPGLAAVVSSRTCLRRPAMMTWLPSL
jgi:hypothetical protein